MKDKQNKLHFRQGDVGIWKIDNLNGKKLISRKPTDHMHVLAYGEATGHHHGINLLDFPDVEMFDIVGEAEYILRVKNRPATVKHQEHDSIILNPGDYLIGIQLEHDPEGERRVID
jgi:hypothetical protein